MKPLEDRIRQYLRKHDRWVSEVELWSPATRAGYSESNIKKVLHMFLTTVDIGMRWDRVKGTQWRLYPMTEQMKSDIETQRAMFNE